MSASIAIICDTRCCRRCASAGRRWRRPSSRSAAHVAEAQQQLSARRGRRRRWQRDGATLRVSALRLLDLPARRNLLIYWIAARGLGLARPAPPARDRGPLLEARRRCDRRACSGAAVSCGAMATGCSRSAAHESAAQLQAQNWDWRAPGLARPRRWFGSGTDRRPPWRSATWRCCPVRCACSSAAAASALQTAHGRKPLKDLLQAHGIAPWQRGAVPLLCSGSRILAVADLWLGGPSARHDLTAGARAAPALATPFRIEAARADLLR